MRCRTVVTRHFFLEGSEWKGYEWKTAHYNLVSACYLISTTLPVLPCQSYHFSVLPRQCYPCQSYPCQSYLVSAGVSGAASPLPTRPSDTHDLPALRVLCLPARAAPTW